MTLSSPDASKKLTLTVSAAQSTAALTVMNHAWGIVEVGIGKLSVDLEPGLYKIEAQLSRNSWSKHVSLRDRSVHVEVPFFGIKSAVPGHVFTRSHEYHEAHLNAAVNRTDVCAGKGARVLMIARNWSPGGGASTGLPRLTLERWRGDELANLQANGTIDLGGDAVGSCAVEISPGAYVVSAETPFGRMSQSVYAKRGWETQVFVLQDFTSQQTTASETVHRPTVSVTQAIVEPFKYDLRLYELIETGQSALSERRAAIGKTLFNEAARAKWQAPILGLLTAHILLLADSKGTPTGSGNTSIAFNRGKFEVILKNTAKLLGETQPDILALRSKSEEMPLSASDQVTTPPLFTRSWDLLLRASEREYPNLLRDSLWRRVRGNTNTAPYFTWLRADSVFAEQRRATERRLAEDLVRAADTQSLTLADRESMAMTFTKGARTVPETLPSRSSKPDISNLADYAPKLDISQLFTESMDLGDAVKQVSRFANMPYSATENLIDQSALRRLLGKTEDE